MSTALSSNGCGGVIGMTLIQAKYMHGRYRVMIICWWLCNVIVYGLASVEIVRVEGMAVYIPFRAS